MGETKLKAVRRTRRRRKIRGSLSGAPDRPRLAGFRSLKHIYVQIIDDSQGRTLAASSTTADPVKGTASTGGNIAAAKLVGADIARRAKELGIAKVAFDRGGFKYHGRIKALADAAREAGLDF